ncbi:hypothetical protein C8Q70DRAFT_919178, partial [Cubamyces menziesii]
LVSPPQELIKVRGFQVPPAEIEGHLLDYHDVGNVCVVGILNEYNGELPFAFVVPGTTAQARIDANPAAAEDVCKTIMMMKVSFPSVYPDTLVGVEYIDANQKSPSGKLLRRFLRDRTKTPREARS